MIRWHEVSPGEWVGHDESEIIGQVWRGASFWHAETADGDKRRFDELEAAQEWVAHETA